MLQVLYEGGIFAWLALGLGILAGTTSLVGFIIGLAMGQRGVRLVFALISLFGAAALGLLGWAGHGYGVSMVNEALRFAAGGDLLPLLFKGHQESTWAMQVALWTSLMPVFFGLLLLMLGLGTPSKIPAPAEAPGKPDAKAWVAGVSAALGASLCLLAAVAYFLFDAFYLPMMWLV